MLLAQRLLEKVDCVHFWRSDGFVYDFGRYGFSYRWCFNCGRTQVSDPWKENVWEDVKGD